jgi:ectoine hydroxylase-related dioxygenase (phytanoyl-CoA dioxygenase family)
MNTNYSIDRNALDIPWIESPFFYSLLENSNLTEEQKTMCINFHEKGYAIIDLNLDDSEIEPIVNDMYDALNGESTVFHADHFTYSDSKRIFEQWKRSDSIARLTLHPKITEALTTLYGKEPFPFSTINFIKGSNQPMHSDVIHFHTVPSLWMCGVWVAFEDVNETNGSLQIIPGSHKWPAYEYHNLKLPHPDTLENGEAVTYRQYEHFVKSLIENSKVDPYIVKLKKGQALIWAANMLHGGCNVEGVTDLNNTRLTQAIHYFFGGCEQYYHPMFSEKTKAKYATKWCNDTNNIKTYLGD